MGSGAKINRAVDVEIARNARSVRAGIELEVRSTLYLTSMALVAIYFLVWPVWRAQFPLEIWYTEGWNAYLQDAAGSFSKLYPAADSLTGNNYPPLSFYAVGLLARVTGVDSLYVGRALSFVGLLAVAAEIFLAGRILTQTIVGPAIGALWYVAIMAHNFIGYVGANDPQIAGEAIMGAALVMFLARDADGRSPLPALLLMVLGGFWKHNMIAVPLTSMVWLMLRDKRRALWPIFISGSVTIAGLLTCRVLFGSDFFSSLFATRLYSWRGITTNIGHLQWCALAAGLWATWALGDRHSKSARFTAIHIAIGFGVCILQWTGDGVSRNAEFDLILALGIGTGVAFANIRDSLFAQYIAANYLRDAMIILLLVRLVASERQESAHVMFDVGFRNSFDAGAHQVAHEVSAVTAIPGDVYCGNDIVCRLAGKPYAVDDFKLEQMQKTGRYTPDEISGLLKSLGIRRFTNDPITFTVNHSW
jgi:hypothetical protein